MSAINAIGTAVPKYKHRQSDIAQFYINQFSLKEEEKRKVELLYERSGISTRYSTLPDFSGSLNEKKLYPKAGEGKFPLLEERMQHYNAAACNLAVAAVRDCTGNHQSLGNITHLITVSCTGMSAPGLDIDLMQALNLKADTQRSSVNFMGCYAAILALKQADAICKADKNAEVLIVCVELCTLHFQDSEGGDNMASTLLFADGAAALIVSDKINNPKALEMQSFYSWVDIKGKKDMAWNLSSGGFLMTLSAYIPQLLELNIKSLLSACLKKAQLGENEINFWAIHPGGRKILETIATELNLTESNLKASYQVLKEYGNMSSPTICFVIKQIWEQEVKEKGQKIFCAAFGPGLSMETLILES